MGLNYFLTLSDSAKLASTARHFLVDGLRYASGHNFFDPRRLALNQGEYLPADLPRLPIWILAGFFKLFNVSDLTVALAGITFFALSLWLIYQIGNRLFGRQVGVLAVIFTLFNLDLVTYSINFSTDILFASEILLFIYFLFLPSRPINLILSIASLGLMLLTRQQAFVFILVAILYLSWSLFKSSKLKSGVKVGIIVISALFLVGFVVRSRFRTNEFMSPARLIGAIHLPTDQAQGQFLRGSEIPELSASQLASKVFYNTYNFLIAPQRIAPPLILWLFFIAIFLKSPRIESQKFIYFSTGVILLFAFAAAATLPNARYLHPLIPLMAIGAAYALKTIVAILPIRWRTIALVSTVLFVILPVLGHWTIDGRFRKTIYNVDKPPAHRVIAARMNQHINPHELIITNLDAWAAWYENLNTMWFPASPEQLRGLENKVDYIVITDLLASDQDFSLNDWERLLVNPASIKSSSLGQNFDLLLQFVIPAETVYENQEIKGVIFVNAKK